MKIMRLSSLTLALLSVAIAPAAAEMPSIRNGNLTTQSASTGLDAAFRKLVEHQSEPAWIGYEVPSLPGHRMYCGNSERRDCLCRLESNHESYSQTSSDDSDETQEPGIMFVLFRVQSHRVERIRGYSSYCRLDAGGLPLFWLTDVRPSESVALLESFAEPSGSLTKHTKGMTDGAITSIAFHADPAAAIALENLVRPDKPVEVRKQAIFWVGENGGPHGVDVLRRVLHDDPDHEVREGAVFALSCSSSPAALDLLMQTARDDKDPKIRSNALFWLANKASDKSAKAIAEAVENDPDADVKEQAVFALSQLPKERGVPLLIQVARTNRSSKVREQAIFWLGQSEDDRALDFFEEVLSH